MVNEFKAISSTGGAYESPVCRYRKAWSLGGSDATICEGSLGWLS